MAKKTGTKHHVVIKLEDLNKMFKGNDVIPVPKGFVKSIEFLLSAHNVSLADVPKDSAEVVPEAAATDSAAVLTKVEIDE